MIHALNVTGRRDIDLSDMMIQSLKTYCQDLGEISVVWGDDVPWGNGAGWEAAMLKVNWLKKFRNIRKTDFVLCVDSDVLFCTREVFEYVNPAYGIIGILGTYDPPVKTHIGYLNHMSGCCMFIRGDYVRKICRLTEEELNEIRQEFKNFILCENEDVVLSYLAQRLGAHAFALPGYLSDGDLNLDIPANSLKSFYHMNYAPTEFLGQKVTGKWDIPKVLRQTGFI